MDKEHGSFEYTWAKTWRKCATDLQLNYFIDCIYVCL